MASSDHESNAHSPSHIAMTGHDFSPEDIQDLLGGVLHDYPPHHPPTGTFPGEESGGTTNSSNSLPDTNHSSNKSNKASNESAGITEDDRAQARTERKRRLEKQRRSDVNKQFNELSNLLRVIETEAPDQIQGLPAYSPANRVDLMSRTVVLLHNLHQSNKKRKLQIEDLEIQLDTAKKAGEDTAAKLKESMMAPQSMGNNKVVMMVPMVIGDGSNTGSAAAASGTAAPAGSTMPMMQPWMPQYGMPMPPPSTASEAPSMPWMMPPMPWMMPPNMMQQAQPPTGGGAAPSKGSDHSSSNNNKKVSGNLAHCA